MEWNRGRKPWNWRGEKIIASNGYVLVFVGKEHHLADVRGYAYEHRIVAERMLGRKLEPGELVHHRNEIKSDNRPENLEVVKGNAEHFLRHRKSGCNRRLPDEPNHMVACLCGCGEEFLRYDDSGRPREYITGHNAPSHGLRQSVLWYLENVPEPSTVMFMASFYAVDPAHMSKVMFKLKRKGLVESDNGIWRLTNAN